MERLDCIATGLAHARPIGRFDPRAAEDTEGRQQDIEECRPPPGKKLAQCLHALETSSDDDG